MELECTERPPGKAQECYLRRQSMSSAFSNSMPGCSVDFATCKRGGVSFCTCISVQGSLGCTAKVQAELLEKFAGITRSVKYFVLPLPSNLSA